MCQQQAKSRVLPQALRQAAWQKEVPLCFKNGNLCSCGFKQQQPKVFFKYKYVDTHTLLLPLQGKVSFHQPANDLGLLSLLQT